MASDETDAVVGSEKNNDNVDTRLQGLRISTPSGGYGDVAAADYRYAMNGRKRGPLLIINNKDFDPVTRMGERSGTDKDANALYHSFRKLGFDVTLKQNLKAVQMLDLMIEASKYDYSNCDCFAVAVLSHGDEGELYGVDGVVKIDQFVNPIKDCASLAGKPKIFIFQACRGTQLDSGMLAKDAIREDKIVKIPREADFLYAYSTTPGYFSWRNSRNGSWFIQALCKILDNADHSQIDLVRLLTRVNNEVSLSYESNAAQEYMTRKKQVPSIVSMLRKEVYLEPKK